MPFDSNFTSTKPGNIGLRGAGEMKNIRFILSICLRADNCYPNKKVV
ncbi:hypothetical protein NEISICOT_00148 [Neisseria sicca ATCC 29256]|uniref:Uncharacterized protein n=1 Tax=Neisseria sicca ATCC 29256 TaxID=547045 RepID=C6M0X1_NEISI|nr:hypothetical protein NEISICOT_00148 [Neisseria sicca ATCC 29256]